MLSRLFKFLSPLLLVWSALASAQSLEPRAYTNLPVGQTFVVVGIARSEGDVSPTPSSPLQDLDLRIDSLILGAAHTFSIAGKAAKFDFAGFRMCYERSANFMGEYAEDRRCEYGDPRFKLTWNFYGAPAMDLEAFRQARPGLVIGASVEATAPVGTYNSENIINAGANRWMVRPGIGMSYGWNRWHIDFSGSIRLFEDNDDFFNGIHVEQDPLYQLQGHLVYNFPKGRWLALNANVFWGGENTRDGVEADDRLENSRLGITYSTPITAHHSIKFYASAGTVTRIGGDFDSFGIAWQYRF